MKKSNIAYYVSTVLFSLLIVMGAGMYFFNHEMVAKTFLRLGYPTHIIYPLAVVKLLGLVAIWTKYSNVLKEWAYAGFFFDIVLAMTAHTVAKDGEVGGAILAFVLLLTSYFFERRLASLKRDEQVRA